jgi:hypothetical protein
MKQQRKRERGLNMYMILKKMLVLSNLVLTKYQNNIKGIDTLTISSLLVLGDNKVKSHINNTGGDKRAPPHT